MVDLAKLRKKAKEKKERPQASGLGPQEETPAEPSQAAPEAPPEVTPDKIAAYLETAGESQRKVDRAQETSGDEVELLTFVIAGEHYAIGIDDVVEIVTPRPVTRIPNADPSILGILSLRGAIVMLVDARRRLRHPPATESGADERVIVVQEDSENVGFIVDRVLRVVKIDAGSIGPNPVVHTSEQDDAVRGVFRHGGALTILLDLRKLILTKSEWN